MNTVTVVPEHTKGTSPKAILAAALPAIGTVLAVLILWVVTGEFDKAELATSLTGLVGSLTAGFGAWLGNPGTVVVDPAQNPQIQQPQSPEDAEVPADVGPASDSLLEDKIPPNVQNP